MQRLEYSGTNNSIAWLMILGTQRAKTVGYRKISNISRTTAQKLNISLLDLNLSLRNLLKPGVKSWRCSWSSADRRCFNCTWGFNFIAHYGATYTRGLTVAKSNIEIRTLTNNFIPLFIWIWLLINTLTEMLASLMAVNKKVGVRQIVREFMFKEAFCFSVGSK